MLHLPTGFENVISSFSFAFRKDVWSKVKILLVGSILCLGSRTICNILRTLGLYQERNFPKYHRFLSQDKWSAFKLSSILLSLLVDTFIPKDSPLVFGLDDTIERRWGRKISKRGIYRDPVRSSKSHFVKCSGLRWLSLMLLTNLPWLEAGIVWALPFLTVLCPSEKFYTQQGKKVKKLTDFARQMIIWLGRKKACLQRPICLVGDGSFATLQLFQQSKQSQISMIARMKLNSRLYELPSEPCPNKPGPKSPVGERLKKMEELLNDKDTKWQSVTFSNWYGNQNKEMLLTSGIAIWRKSNTEIIQVKWVLLKDPEGKNEPLLLASSDFEMETKDIVSFFVRRWRVEVTFAEVRRHLGVETQRQWTDLAIERTTPCLMALFSIVCLFTNQLHKDEKIEPTQTAWYKKKKVTFSDVLARVRRQIIQTEQVKQPEELLITSQNSLIKSYKHKIRYLTDLVTQAVA